MLVANNLSSANNLTQRENSKNLNSSNKELDGVFLGVSLEKIEVVSWSLERIQAEGLESLKNSLELSSGRRSKTFLDVDLLSKLNYNLGPKDRLRNKT